MTTLLEERRNSLTSVGRAEMLDFMSDKKNSEGLPAGSSSPQKLPCVLMFLQSSLFNISA